MYPRTRRHGGKHGRRKEPRGFNAHFERRKKERRKTRTGSHGGDEASERLVNAAVLFAIKRLKIDAEGLKIEWADRNEIEAWGDYRHSLKTVRLATDFPTRRDLLEVTFHELAHASQAQTGRMAELRRKGDEATMEDEADKVAKGLLCDFLDHFEETPGCPR